jgi:hypothetical protein
LDQTQHVFSLSGRPGIGVNCGEQGFFVGDVLLGPIHIQDFQG